MLKPTHRLVPALLAALAAPAAHANPLRIDFTVHFSQATGGPHNLGTFNANVTVTGSYTWDSSAVPFFNNGVNTHYFPNTGFNEVCTGTVHDGGPVNVGFTATYAGGGTTTSPIQTVHSGGNSDVYWRSGGGHLAAPAGYLGTFEIQLLLDPALPLYTSPLPANPGDYSGPYGFSADYILERSNGNGPDYYFSSPDQVHVTVTAICYANCDGSTTSPMLNVLDFSCFLNRYAAGDTYANCDGSTTPPVLNVLDFACFLNRYAVGCQ